jgi:hypothetical protein
MAMQLDVEISYTNQGHKFRNRSLLASCFLGLFIDPEDGGSISSEMEVTNILHGVTPQKLHS